ncbi:MAG: hypothetical protein ACR2HQ_10005 [Ilumatobacteraceae bacterium]
MNRTWMVRIGVSLLVAASLVAVAGVAYRVGDRDDVGRVAREVVVGEDGARTVIVSDGWRDGWHGPGFGFLFFPLVVVGVILLVRSRRDRWGSWPGRDEAMRDWHRRQHTPDVPAPPSAPGA